jgi:monovalent cation:H+ antiporter-2, CPA2 family
LIMGIMIFQDIIAIPMMLSLPFLAGTSHSLDSSHLLMFGKGLILLVVVLFSAAKFIPPIFFYIAQTRSRELFLLSVLTICFAVAWLTAEVGLSLSLGAFLAGLTISDTEYRTEAIGDILPLQDIFTSLFFVSIGMLLNLDFVIHHPLLILLATLSVLALKTSMAGVTAIVLGLPLRTVIIAAIALCQVGEFSFVIAKSGLPLGLADDYHYQLFLAVSLITMAITPTLMQFSPAIADLVVKLPLPTFIKSGYRSFSQKEHVAKKDHVIITGFGLSGRQLAQAAKEAKLSYVIIDMNPETVVKEKQNGEPIFYGDATHENVMHHAYLTDAKILAVVINDAIAAERIVEKARQLNPRLYIIVRTRYLREMRTMISLGADEVIPDEFGSSVEIFTRVLKKFHVPSEDVQRIISTMRVEGYEMLRLLYKEPTTLADLKITLSDILIETYRVASGSLGEGKTIGELELRRNYGVTAMLIKRDDVTITQIGPQTTLLAQDVVVICGTYDNLLKSTEIFKTQAPLEAIPT